MPLSNSSPVLPPLNNQQLILQVFSHKTLHGSTPAEEGDNERLSEIGSISLSMAVTAALFSQRPTLSGSDITHQREHFFNEDNILKLVDTPELWGQLRFSTSEAKEQAKSSEELRFLLCAYMGAVYSTTGLSSIQTWANQIINPGGASQEFSYNSVSSPSFPLGATLPANTDPMAPSTTTAPAGTPILAMFNQTCQQRQIAVTWEGESVGPPHNPRWTMKCLMNGEVKGQAAARNQKAAKEAAARSAWVAVGWGGL